MIITGIGSRDTPPHICQLFKNIGKEIRALKWFVRSGHAQGADYAFEDGAEENCIVYLPFPKFNNYLELFGTPAKHQQLRPEVLEIVYKHEPYAEKLSNGIKLIKSRNVYQILGVNLDSPSNLVICWTPKGEVVGGTGLALKIAAEYDIPILNYGSKIDLNWKAYIRQ